ncbi:MAG TPA: hypothetical protein VE978_15310 [Chitinophagales bacterium]|nr:hypothetical protein [Chitinophagales bacterium]
MKPVKFEGDAYEDYVGWSKEEHRLIYKIENDTIVIQSVRGHY